MKPKKKILLTFPYQKDERVTVEKDGIDNWNLSFTRGQGIFAMPDRTPVIALHMLAQNTSHQTVVLEYPTLADYRKELAKGYDYVGITYTIPHTGRVLHMAELAKEVSPASKVIIGGYGNQCLDQTMFPTDALQKNADYICREEGIAFMRNLLGETEERPIKQLFPLGGFMPFGNWNLSSKHFFLTVSLGCQFGCEFCATSAYFNKKRVYLLNPKECYDAIKYNLRQYPHVNHCLIYDEDFLWNKAYVDELGEYLKNDAEIQKRKFSYYCFSSVNAISQYTPEELIENGVAGVYMGVESCLQELFSRKMVKRKGRSVQEVFDMCNQYGIMTIATYILGWDFHTRDNIMTDIDYYVNLKPTMVQLRPLLALPQTKIWEDRLKEGRLSDQDQTWENMNLFSRSYQYQNFTHDEVFGYLDYTADKVNQTHGPSTLRMLNLLMDGYDTLNGSANPYLQRRAELLAENAKMAYPALAAIMKFPYNDHVRSLAVQTQSRYGDTFGNPGIAGKIFSALAVMQANKRKKYLEKTGNIVPLPPCRRYEYNM